MPNVIAECVNNTIWIAAKLLKVNLQHMQATPMITATIAAAAPAMPTDNAMTWSVFRPSAPVVPLAVTVHVIQNIKYYSAHMCICKMITLSQFNVVIAIPLIAIETHGRSRSSLLC